FWLFESFSICFILFRSSGIERFPRFFIVYRHNNSFAREIPLARLWRPSPRVVKRVVSFRTASFSSCDAALL
ncbi:MAG: hypothetical protein AABZ40_02290, partial [Thermodesulfobacteriota bacterium]